MNASQEQGEEPLLTWALRARAKITPLITVAP